MRIVILDGLTTNPGDVSWEPLERLGSLTVFDRTAPGDVAARAADADAILTNKAIMGREQIAALPQLKYVGVLATGFNIVDVAAARERGIPVCNVPEYSTPNVVQAAWALILELANRVGHHDRTVHEGHWAACHDFCYWHGVGHGRIGRGVAAVGRAFGMRVIHHRRQGGGDPACVDLDTLFRESDVVSLHCPLTPETKGLVDARRLALMKPTAFLVNTARGPLVDEAALAAALNAGQIAGAAVDVLSVEPPPASNPLLTAKNCVITPHVAWATRDARRRLIDVTAANLAAFAVGQPQNVVNA